MTLQHQRTLWQYHVSVADGLVSRNGRLVQHHVPDQVSDAVRVCGSELEARELAESLRFALAAWLHSGCDYRTAEYLASAKSTEDDCGR